MSGFPRFLTIAGWRVHSYKILLAVGICVGTLATAAMADTAGLSPLRVGLAAMASALAGLIGARLYHLLVHAPRYLGAGSPRALWHTASGGMSVFGALLTFVPVSVISAAVIDVPAAVLWDQMAVGVLAGGFCIRLGCVCNGCCAGRETNGPFGVLLHDTLGVRKRRIPVQFLEMAWWVLGLAAFVGLWPTGTPAGSFALAVLAWYGVGRFFLEPLRESPAVIGGRVRINQLVALLIAVGASGALILIAWRS
ncbi:prolipoprotein diacylglyceryl transferase [Mycolicibacterium pulveris]|uniref:prolipoprotein diacylglyceryl transferase n=1 Tax=Mycolicibacterium pulveris TaxID=36813 RepID=UPI003CE778CA